MKRYKAKLTADYKYTGIGGKKGFETLSIEFLTEPLKKRPTQAFFKSCVKLVVSRTVWNESLLDGIDSVSGLAGVQGVLHDKRKVTNFNFMYIEEY